MSNYLSLKSLGPGGFHSIAFQEWGDPDNPEVLICVHGLTRNSHDFDALAQDLKDKYRIICPDLVGRGKSTFTQNPATYNIEQYVRDMVALIARTGVDQVSWLGTSLGGLIGMMIASQNNAPIKKLIMNDVGMVIPKESIIRIKAYASLHPAFNNLEEAAKDLATRVATFGPIDDDNWQNMIENSFEKGNDGKWRYTYDPVIMKAVEQSVIEDTHLEPIWAGVKCPTLIVRGSNSDLLLKKTVEDMIAIHPGAKSTEIPDAGHAPSLSTKGQILIIKNWLETNC